jgi:endonuclease G, mitochondrial
MANQDELAKALKNRYERRRPERDKRMKAIADVGAVKAAGIDSAIRRATHLTVADGRNFEAIVGGNDLAEVSFLDKGVRAARAVCRLSQANQPIGTGFLVAPGIIMTNHHVLEDAEAARSFVAEFNYQLDVDDQPMRTVRFALAPERLFVTSPANKLDFTLVALRPTSDSGAAVNSFGWLPLDGRTDKILEGEPIVIVEHPDGRTKEICLFHSELVDRVECFLHFTTDTMPGSSGSPCFNRQWQVVGLHHASVDTGEKERGTPKLVNEGIRISSIIDALKTGQDVTGDRATALGALTSPSVVQDGRPCSGTPREPADARPALERTSIGVHPASHYQGRKGYDDTFLGKTGALSVPFPKPSDAVLADLARITGTDDYELRYCHFSLAVSASRKMPVATAVNIDGAHSQHLSRTDRDPDNPETSDVSYEAADKWYYDGRIPTDAQLGPAVYDQTEFDYGHMVRREDPVWGTDLRTPRVANDDTFTMANCTTQHHDLNTKTWQTLENAILNSARKNKKRVTVLTGPVLSVSDPEILGVQVPTAFWKIAVWAEGEALHARGFMEWQTELVESMRAEYESLPGLEKAQQYQVPIAEIARLTGLDFGVVLGADELKAGGRRRITDERIADVTTFGR